MRLYDYFKTVFQVYVLVSSSSDKTVMAELSRHKVEQVQIRFIVLSLNNYKLYPVASPLGSLCNPASLWRY